jgi:hypothetical protein
MDVRCSARNRSDGRAEEFRVDDRPDLVVQLAMSRRDPTGPFEIRSLATRPSSSSTHASIASRRYRR